MPSAAAFLDEPASAEDFLGGKERPSAEAFLPPDLPLVIDRNRGNLGPSTTAGGPPLSLPEGAMRSTLNELAGQGREVVTHEGIKFGPDLEVKPDDSRTVAVGKEVVNLAKGLPEFFTSGPGMTAIAAGAVAPVATSTFFTADMLHSLGEQVLAAHKDWDAMTPAQHYAAVTRMAGTGLMAGLAGKHATSGLLDRVVPARGLAKEIREAPLTPGEETPTALVQAGEPNAQPPDRVLEMLRQPQEAPGSDMGNPITQPPEPTVTIPVTEQSTAGSDRPAEQPTAPAAEPAVTVPPVTAEQFLSEPAPGKIDSNPEPPLEKTVPANPEIIGMGGATASEFGPNEGADITGIAQRVRKQVAAAGQEELAPIGEGISAEDSVEHGEALLLKDPTAADTAMDYFEKTGAVPKYGMALARAKLRRFAFEARRIEEAFGTDSPQYEAEFKARSDWAARSKKMQTAWSDLGREQQGEQDIDTGSFTGLRSAYVDDTGKDFTPQQAKQAKEKAEPVNRKQKEADAAKAALNEHIAIQSGDMTTAERRALDAANKTVRENAIRLADAETKSRLAKTERDRATAKVQEDAARKALEASNKTVRDAARRLADAENAARVKESAKRPPNDQQKAAQRALDSANAAVRKAAADAAKAESRARLAKTNVEKAQAKIQADAAAKALDAANKTVRDAAARAAAAEVDARVNPEKRVLQKLKDYLDSGADNYDDMVNKAATDLGMTVRKVKELLARNPRTKFLANEAWRKQEALRRLQNNAKRWLKSTQIPAYQKWLAAVPRTMFALKIGFGLHGFVPLGTHAPMLFFRPTMWKTYFQNYGRMVKQVGSTAFYESMRQDLLRNPNYLAARRAGLANDPSHFEEYSTLGLADKLQSKLPTKAGELAQAFFGAGNRGYSILKNLRQDIFDHHWNALPKTDRTPEMAKAIADAVNHVTGITRKGSPPGANLALFAPRLAASRAMWLAGDPIRAVDTALRWKTASRSEKWFAIQQLKEKAWAVGTLTSLLAANQAMLSATGSDQDVNFNDPTRSDFLKFKVAGMNLSYGNAMLNLARLPVRLWAGIENEGKFNKIVYEDENVANTLMQYARTQLSPFAGTAADLGFGRDYERRPLPRAGFGFLEGKTNMPKRLVAQGAEPYTWAEFSSQRLLPIPAEEAMREVWRDGMGMDAEQIRKAFATIFVMSATGARLTDDYEAQR